MSLLFFSLIFFQASVASKLHDVGFVIDYFISEEVRTVTSALCNEETNVWLLKQFSQRKIGFDCLDLNHLNESEAVGRLALREGSNGVVLDLKCPHTWDFLKLADEKKLFTFGMSHWLLITTTHISKRTLKTLTEAYTPTVSDPIKYLTQPYQDRKNEKYLMEMNRNINIEFLREHEKSRKETKKPPKIPANKTEIDDLLEMKILRDDVMTFAVPESHPNARFYVLYSIYKNTAETKPQIHETGRARPQKLDVWKRVRRKNLGNALLRATCAVLQPELFTTIDDLKTREADILGKMSYPHTKLLSEDLNFRFLVRFFDDYGWQKNGTFSHLVGFLQRKKADLSAGSLMLRRDRLGVIDYLECAFPLETGIMFREPSLSSVSNIFLLPFSKSVWIAIFVLIVLLMLALRCRIVVEKLWIPPDENLSGFADIVNYVIGAVCQQGSSVTPKSSSARVLILIALLTSLALFTSYSACIVALLQSSSSAITTVEDLTHSNFEVGMQSRFPLFKVIMQEATHPILKEFYRKKVLPRGEKVFFDRREGIERMRTGMFAFEVELPAGYKVISETYQEIEKCGIKEIRLIQKPVMCMSAPTLSPYRELFRQRWKWQHEAGFFDRSYRLWTDQKPKCEVGRIGFISVGLKEFKPALQVFGYGIAATILAFIAEILFAKRMKIFTLNKRKPQKWGERRFHK